MPPEKTNLTNTAVQESAESQAAQETLNPSSKELENKIRENLRKEYSSKEEALAEKLEATESRLAELDEKVRLSEAEKAEQKRLQRNVNSLEDQLRVFETDPQFDAAREHIKKANSQTKEEAKTEALKQFYTDQVDYLIRKEAKKRGIDPKQFRKDINSELRAEHMEIVNLIERAEIGIEMFDKSQKDVKDREQFEKDKLEHSQFSESGQRIPRGTSLEDAKKSGNLKAEAVLLGL